MTTLLTVIAAGDTAASAEHPGFGGGGIDRQLGASVHRALGCGSCHGAPEHAPPGRAPASCGSCHRRAAAELARGPHGLAARRGDPNVPTCVSCHGSHGVKPARAAGAPTAPREAPMTCGRCHQKAGAEFAAGVHGQSLARGAAGAASCASCHGAHEAAGPLGARSPVGRPRLAETCGGCHVEARLAFGRSVHGSAVARGVPHAPTCTSCHGSHAIPGPRDPRSPTSVLRVAGETCARCHGSVRIAAMHGLPTRVVEDFRGSFHGLTGAAGDRRVANCASCHGYHEVRPSSNPFSRVSPASLGRTCGECHPGATATFARGGVHHSDRTFGHRLVDLVGSMYGGMVAIVIGLMAAHNAIDFQRRWRDRARPGGAAGPDAAEPLLRFTGVERAQHWLLAGSFATLAASGFALRLGWRLPWVSGDIQETGRAMIHRGAATVFVALVVYHVGYLLVTARGRALARAILPRVWSAADVARCGLACMRLGPPGRSDWRELIATLRYNLGLVSERPAYGRFAYWEKMEYWALAWGAVVMVATGLVLWLETPFLNRFPYWAFELFRTVHFYEALLAMLAILVWHLYYTVINPDVFPLNRAMTRGWLTREEMERDHPLELEEDTTR
jgi:cytochrome b subunit of formate dehydrogenase